MTIHRYVTVAPRPAPGEIEEQMTTRTPAGATPVPAPRRGSRRDRRAVPERSPAFGHVGLADLREYRSALQAEEGRVSYWRRILQARLDLLQAGSPGADPAAADLGPVLSDDRVRSGRTALVEVMPVDDIPPLPALAELWERRVAAADADGIAALARDLQQAEEQLSSYRSALHRRLTGATDELIARYREEPVLCLAALPLPPGRAGARP